MDPLIERENAQERLIIRTNKILRDEEIMKANIEFYKKPYWIQQNEEGDRMSDGSDEQGWDLEEND